MKPALWNDPVWLQAEWVRAKDKSERLSLARAALPPGSSRARVTTANAKWKRAAEYRDLVAKRIEELRAPVATVPIETHDPADAGCACSLCRMRVQFAAKGAGF